MFKKTINRNPLEASFVSHLMYGYISLSDADCNRPRRNNARKMEKHRRCAFTVSAGDASPETLHLCQPREIVG